MYAIVEIAGKQFKVQKDQKLYVHRLKEDEGKKVTFDRVLMVDNKDKVSFGSPVISGAQVGAKVLKHLKSDKVIVFKKKRRKGYRVKNGHRQLLTQIQIVIYHYLEQKQQRNRKQNQKQQRNQRQRKNQHKKRKI